MLTKKKIASAIVKIGALGYTAAYIKGIQTRLNKLGWKLVVDGIAGTKTVTAVWQFQKHYKLILDGVPGAQTKTQLDKSIAQLVPSRYVEDWSKIKYFKASEFACSDHCTYKMKVWMKLIIALTMIRTHFNTPIMITSGIRCSKKNASLVGSSPTSMHMYGRAADFHIHGIDIKDILAYCAILKKKGYISYYYTNNTNMKGAVHIQV